MGCIIRGKNSLLLFKLPGVSVRTSLRNLCCQLIGDRCAFIQEHGHANPWLVLPFDAVHVSKNAWLISAGAPFTRYRDPSQTWTQRKRFTSNYSAVGHVRGTITKVSETLTQSAESTTASKRLRVDVSAVTNTRRAVSGLKLGNANLRTVRSGSAAEPCKKVEGIGGGSSSVVAPRIPNYRKQPNHPIIRFYILFID